MNKKILIFAIAALVVNSLFAQTTNLGEPLIFKEKITKTKTFFTTPSVDNLAEIEAEKVRSSMSGDKMYRFGKEHFISIDVLSQAEKTVLPNGDLLYQYGIECKNAVSINLVFDQFVLAKGARMYFTDPVKMKYDGAYTSLNNNASKMLGTELIYAEKAIIEVVVPQDQEGLSILNIGTIVHGYRSLNDMAKSLNSSGNCEIDVNCPLGLGWENQRNSVAMMVNGGGFCTGSLVNNTSGTIIPYFLSANHCGTNPGGWVFRFRWESPEGQVDCGTTAPSVDGPATMNVNGGTLCASNGTSDFTLTLLNTAPDPTWGVYYNGWDRTDIPATQLTGIHHPSSDIKKISRDNSTAVSSAFNGGTADSHWRVPSWDQGVTEGGSSGSPLFNQNHRTIGQLHGGASACGAQPQDLNDDYGKFFLSWTGGGTNSSRLSNWLDPGNLGSEFIDGVDPATPLLTDDAGISNSVVNFGTICGGTLTPQVDIYNPGSTSLTAATIHYGFDGATNLTYNWTGSLASYGTATITLPTATLSEGNHTFTAIIQNSTTDLNNSNDTTSTSFVTVTNGEVVTLNMIINCYASENAWQVTDTLLQTVYATGGPYSDTEPVPIIDSFCLAIGCYTFTLTDSYGDGILGGPANTCDSGSYVLTSPVSGQLGELLPLNSNFGFSTSSQFCLGDAGIEKLLMQPQITIYPNPTSTNFTVTSLETHIKKVNLMTITGQMMYENASVTGPTNIDVSSYAKGMYLIQIKTDKGIVTKQLIVR